MFTNFLGFVAEQIENLCDCLADIDLSFLGTNWDISFYKLVLIVFFGGSAFDIAFSKNNIDEEGFFDD